MRSRPTPPRTRTSRRTLGAATHKDTGSTSTRPSDIVPTMVGTETSGGSVGSWSLGFLFAGVSGETRAELAIEGEGRESRFLGVFVFPTTGSSSPGYLPRCPGRNWTCPGGVLAMVFRVVVLARLDHLSQGRVPWWIRIGSMCDPKVVLGFRVRPQAQDTG